MGSSVENGPSAKTLPATPNITPRDAHLLIKATPTYSNALGSLPSGWIMIKARPRLGLGHRLFESVDALALALDEGRL